MNPEELHSTDPEKILKRAMSDVRFARSGYEAGYDTQALLLAIRGIEKLMIFHLMERNVPYSRDSSSLKELIRSLVNTPVHTEEREELCRLLDTFQFEQEDEVMDIIQSEGQYKTLDELGEEDVQEMASEEFDRSADEDLSDWDNDEWGPGGWSKDGEVDVEGFEMNAFQTKTDQRNGEGAENPTGDSSVSPSNDDNRPDPEKLPPIEKMYERALSLFKKLSDLVDGNS